MRRREFLVVMGGAAATWPLAAHTQERMRRIGMLTGIGNEAGGQERFMVFVQAMAQLGWVVGRNMRIDARWGGGDAAVIRKHATEMVALAPDVIMAAGGAAAGSLLQTTRTVPIVFAYVPDPVGSGFVNSLPRPGGNATGFTMFEYSLSGKWLELLKEIAPGVTRAAVLWDPSLAAGIGQYAVIQAVAPSLGMEVFPINVADLSELDRAVAAFAGGGNGGMVVTVSALAVVLRESITALATRHKLPAVYAVRDFVASGGLISYADDFTEQIRRAAGYVDRILKGEKPAGLPVQAPTKYNLVINLKAAKALGLTVPPSVLARADEVIE